MTTKEKLKLFEEMREVLPKSKAFKYNFFSRLLPIVHPLMSQERPAKKEIFFYNDYLLNEDIEDDFYQISYAEELLSNYQYIPNKSAIELELKNINFFLSFLKEKKIVDKFSLRKLNANEIEIEDPLDYEKQKLITSGRLHSNIISIKLNEKNGYLLEEFADIYIVAQAKGELSSERKQETLTAEYILKKYFDLDKEVVSLNIGIFYGLKLLSSSSVDDRQYINPSVFQRIRIMKTLRELSFKEYFCIKSVAYEIKDYKIYPLVVSISITPKQIEKLKNDFMEESEKINPNDKRLKSMHLITESVAVKDVIFLVIDERYEMPFRIDTKNVKGGATYIKKLHDIAYMANAPEKSVVYNKNIADNINNGLFKRRGIKTYLKNNGLKKPTLVQKSEDGKNLVLKNEITIKDILINAVPPQHQYLYIDKTK